MTNLHDARVEAGAKAIEKIPHIVWNSPTRHDAMILADAAIAAADAVVTVEELASEIGRECDCGAGAGSAVCKKVCASRSTALIRGGGEPRPLLRAGDARCAALKS